MSMGHVPATARWAARALPVLAAFMLAYCLLPNGLGLAHRPPSPIGVLYSAGFLASTLGVGERVPAAWAVTQCMLALNVTLGAISAHFPVRTVANGVVLRYELDSKWTLALVVFLLANALLFTVLMRHHRTFRRLATASSLPEDASSGPRTM